MCTKEVTWVQIVLIQVRLQLYFAADVVSSGRIGSRATEGEVSHTTSVYRQGFYQNYSVCIVAKYHRRSKDEIIQVGVCT